MKLRQEFISPKELGDRHLLIDARHYYAALWNGQDGDLDPSGATRWMWPPMCFRMRCGF